MKKRLIKKWKNRYINSLIKDMQKVNCGIMELTNTNEPMVKYVTEGVNYSFLNGKLKKEGERPPRSKGLRKDIINTANVIKENFASFKNPRLRVFEIDTRYGVYLRIIDFSDWPEGYAHFENEMKFNELGQWRPRTI